MRCSASEMFVLNNVRSYPMYRKSVYSFMKRVHSSVKGGLHPYPGVAETLVTNVLIDARSQ